MIEKYLDTIGEQSDYFLTRIKFIYNSKNLLKFSDEIGKVFHNENFIVNVTDTTYSKGGVNIFDFVDA